MLTSQQRRREREREWYEYEWVFDAKQAIETSQTRKANASELWRWGKLKKRYIHHQTISDDAFLHALPLSLFSLTFLFLVVVFFAYRRHTLHTRLYINIIPSVPRVWIATFRASALSLSLCWLVCFPLAIRNTTLFVSWVRDVPSNRYTNTNWGNIVSVTVLFLVLLLWRGRVGWCVVNTWFFLQFLLLAILFLIAQFPHTTLHDDRLSSSSSVTSCALISLTNTHTFDLYT